VWQINRKSGITPGRVLSSGASLDYSDVLIRAVLCQTPGRSKTCKASTKNDPISRQVTNQRRLWGTGCKDCAPAIGFVVEGESFDPHSRALNFCRGA
jgi:hypothetical protein